MADETEQPIESAAAAAAESEKPIDPAPEPASSLAPADRLRAFEDQHFGKDAVRIDGEIEMGHGSLFERAPDDVKAKHAALKRLIAAESDLAKAKAELAAAQEKFDEAEHASG